MLKCGITLLAASLCSVVACSSPAADAPQTTASAVETSWVARSVIYEVFVRDFSPSGDLQGVIQGLDRIAAAAADIVWLMPIQPGGEVNRKGSFGSSHDTGLP